MLDSITEWVSQWTVPMFILKVVMAGWKKYPVEEYPATDSSLLQKETSKRASRFRYIFGPEPRWRLRGGNLDRYSPRSTYSIRGMNRFEGLEPVLDGE